MRSQLKTPVTIFFYRRPEHLKKVIEKVRMVRPTTLYGVSDGAKSHDPEIQKGVERSREVFRNAIDWSCHWELLERPTNLGSYLSVSSGLDWVFEKVGETIILEDDTVPDITFFQFVAELLEKYRDDGSIGAICANNYDDPKNWTGRHSYRLSRYHHSWGWGTWRRAWDVFDRKEKLLDSMDKGDWKKGLKIKRREWKYWEKCFRRTYAKKLDAWDYRWTLSLWANEMMCIIPKMNLVRNIGFDALGTHTVEKEFAGLSMHDTCSMEFPLIHPQELSSDRFLDDQVFRTHYQRLEGKRNLWQKLWARLSRGGVSR